ncbi:MAG: methionyl-tRNA formyltransferase [Akkermansiaceae bacterium]|jgi:methionyl-tRNA formyltransferase|nr:methionyl-tRNA formyltransferase [Akkermansiaceae bacterium]
MRLVFMVTGEISEATFADALTNEHEVVGLVTQPDRPVGRKQVMTAPRVKEMALDAGVPLIQPESVRKAEALDQIRQWAPEVIVVMAYGQILPQALLDIPSQAIINLHASLLPKYRGASCIQAALKNGDPETGWSVIHVVKRLDAGNVILQKVVPILEGETGGELHDRLAETGPAACRTALKMLESGPVEGDAQNESLQTYVPKLGRKDGCLNWSGTARELECLVRAFHPWPGTSAGLGLKKMKIFPPIKIGEGQGQPGELLEVGEETIEIACGSGSLILGEVQLEGSRRMNGGELARGHLEVLKAGLK